MLKVYETIRQEATMELVEHKSRFIGCIIPATSEEEAKSIQEEKMKLDQFIEKYSDDGEPTQTAGMPMLDLLRTKNLVNVLIVVTRYFGGVKLGTGGLVRAYTKTLQSTLDQVAIIKKATYVKIRMTIPYTFAGKMDYYIQKEAIVIKNIEYKDEIHYELYTTKEDSLSTHLIELTNGQCVIKKIGEVVGYIERGKMYEE